MNLSRRKFVKTGALFLPTLAIGQDVIPNRRSVINKSVGLLVNLVSYWKFEDTNGTDSQDSNTLTIAGGNISSGLIGNCFGFSTNGKAQIATCPANLQLGTGKSFSISTWIFPDGGGVNHSIISQYDNTNGGVAYLFNEDTSGRAIGFYVYNGSVTAMANIAIGTLVAATWNHIVFGYDSPNKQIFAFLNNGAKQTASTASDLPAVSTAFVFGPATALAQFQGSVDETAFYSRVLSAANVSSLYNGGAGLPFSSFTL